MAVLLQIDFPSEGPFGDEMSKALVGLAQSISQEPGFIWKIWTENESEKTAGGVYLFQTEVAARGYLKMHSERLEAMGIKNIRSKLLSVNVPLSKINNAPASSLS